MYDARIHMLISLTSNTNNNKMDWIIFFKKIKIYLNIINVCSEKKNQIKDKS
jgi:hypothetical protein